MIQAGFDRPHLVQALTRNRPYFALCIGRIEYRLALHTIGVVTLDISGVIAAFETLREQPAAFVSMPISVPVQLLLRNTPEFRPSRTGSTN